MTSLRFVFKILAVPAMRVTLEKAAEGLSHWEPSKDHDNYKSTTFP
jgi:hypothetical protein